MFIKKSLLPTVPICALLVLAIALTACGKIGKVAGEVATSVAKKTDDVIPPNPLSKLSEAPILPAQHASVPDVLFPHMAARVPIAISRTLRQRTSKLTPFVLYPFKAVMEGTMTTDGVTFSTQSVITISKGCYWTANSKLIINNSDDKKISSNVVEVVITEQLNGQAYKEILSQSSPVRARNSIKVSTPLMVEDSIKFAKKTNDGFTVEQVLPETTTRMANSHALFPIESEIFQLNMLKKNIHTYEYKLVNLDSDQLISNEKVTVYALGKNEAEMDLWETHSESYMTTDGKTVRSKDVEVVTSNSIPLMMKTEDEDITIELFLKDFSLIKEEACTLSD